MIATITSSGQGRCMLCCTETEVVSVDFPDARLRGELCWSDFKKAVKARSSRSDEKPAPRSKSVDSKHTSE